jgi:hypothetical protein
LEFYLGEIGALRTASAKSCNPAGFADTAATIADDAVGVAEGLIAVAVHTDQTAEAATGIAGGNASNER